MTTAHDRYEHVDMLDRAGWRAWLAANHATSPGVWLVYWRKAAGPGRLSYAEAVEEALCFGWIDSRPGPVDELRTKITMTPRKPRSVWSAVNKARIERLLAAGLIAPAGQAKIDAAKADGSWATLESVDALVEPDDLAAALAADPAARAGFDRFAPSRRKPLLLWVLSAKRPATREARIAATLAGARDGTSPLDWARPPVSGGVTGIGVELSDQGSSG